MDTRIRLLMVVIAALPALGIAAETSQPVTLAFKAGGNIRMNLPSGGVDVVGTADERITVSWRSSSADLERKVRVDLRDESNEAVVAIEGPSNHIRYQVEVPRQSSIVIRMSAGDCAVRDVQGDVSAKLLAGNLELRIADPRDYRLVRGSVTSGGLSAKPWGIDKGGLFRSFEATGDGKHEIKMEVLAGQLVIRQE